MVARSRSSLRRSNLRGDLKSAESTTAVIEERTPSTLHHSQRSKRARVESASDQEQFRKRRRIANIDAAPKLHIPLRSRVAPGHASPVTKHVLSARGNVTPTAPVDHPQPLDQTREGSTKNHIVKENEVNTTASKAELLVPHQNDKRSLRSQDGGSRSKSELAMYFHNYEQMLNLEAASPESLTAKTRIVLIDDLQQPSPLPNIPRKRSTSLQNDAFGASKPLHDAQILDLSLHTTMFRDHSPDPLEAEIFYKAHRKAERQEKQLRNIEKERAQHEKVQLDRLLEELKGPDWLKVMGISGVTESEKKLYEPKRAFFIKEVGGLIEKFRLWKEEEKRRKMEKESALIANEEEEEEEDEEEDSENEDDVEEQDEEENTVGEDEDQHFPQRRQAYVRNTAPLTSPLTSDYNEVDALAAQQLHQEAKSAHHNGGHRKTVSTASLPSASTANILDPHKPFKSFYAKRHLRDAAVAGYRRGRTVMAFGEPVPDLEEVDFELPSTILTPDAIKAWARHKRRLRRATIDEQQQQ